MMGYYNNYGYYPHSGGGVFEAFLMILFWVIVVSLVVSAFRWSRGGRCHGKHCGHYHGMDRDIIGGSSALDILKERYAKGEIEKGEYEEKKKTLME